MASIIIINPHYPTYKAAFSVSLEGKGIEPKIELAPPSMDFGVVSPGSSLDMNLQIKNTGDADLFVSGLGIVSGSNFDFVVDPALTFPLPAISKQSQQTIRITFNSSATPSQISRSVWEVYTNPPQKVPFRFSLNGVSAGPRIDVSPNFVDFNKVYSSPAFEEVIIRNVGTSRLKIIDVSLSGDREFSIANLPSNSFPLESGDEKRLQIEFISPSPIRPKNYSSSLTVTSTDSSHPTTAIDVIAKRMP